MNQLSLEDLITKLEEYNPEAIPMVKKAYSYAYYLHDGQLRQSGEPYIIHPLNVAYTLAELHADQDTICAGLLHDTLEDTETTKEEISNQFNPEVAKLVDGVTKISKLNFSSKQDQVNANTRKIITSIMDDVRIVIIKLADRLHNMRTLEFKDPFKQKENSIETLDIFAPLANYIGAYRIKSELEDISLSYLKPDKYKKIKENLKIVEEDSKPCLTEMLNAIKNILSDNNIPNEIKIRTKNIYGIYQQLEDGLRMNDIHDLMTLKIMVDTISNCYQTLGIIHSKYNPLCSKFKDYIYNPKSNMYRSLHTTVFADERLVQAQIRTFDMDKIASFGLTTYWDINKGQARDEMQKDLNDEFQFYKSLKQIDKMFVDNEDFVERVKEELLKSKKIYVYTPKGDRMELPAGSTPIDLAYKIHTQLGNTMVAAIVNDEYVPVEYVLQNKDIVKIITDPKSFGPRKDWLDKAQTTKAKRKILEFNKE
ncbi:MAG: bifunctional (p)ppGpp synthetase/guanosine-3',5'-bis(diphosphate) 3'-pyrophosphohydrolase [Bacilli bacterium]|nr:bifunctional (p)ppGpp synthetase/guanosine-3',5'-bis(diphosphate) 3'-pyrophosphohydrolase [Bacilli bacterium]